MFRLIPALAAAAFFSACALEGDEGLYAGEAIAAPPELRALPADVPPARLAELGEPGEPGEAVRLQRAPGDAVRPVSQSRSLVAQPPPSHGVGVDLELEPGWNAVGLTALVAVPSCGWWPIASASAVGANGEASFTFVPREETGLGFVEAQLFFFVDHDGDQLCDETKGDEVFTASLGQVNLGAQVQVTLGELQSSPYSCSLFSYLP